MKFTSSIINIFFLVAAGSDFLFFSNTVHAIEEEVADKKKTNYYLRTAAGLVASNGEEGIIETAKGIIETAADDGNNNNHDQADINANNHGAANNNSTRKLHGEETWESRWFSEERPNNLAYCPVIHGVQSTLSAINCKGRYCDNLKIECSNRHPLRFEEFPTWTNFFSEEKGGEMLCPSGSVVTGMLCKGKYCDNISLECRELTNAGIGWCHWTDWTVSEENGRAFFSGHLVKGMKCEGRYCDNKKFRLCGIVYN